MLPDEPRDDLKDGQKATRVRQEVTALLESPSFARSKANRALLNYLAEEYLAGRGEAITEYAIAQDLLGRDDDFDPTTDPIVRVRMRRLREGIAAYYDEHPDRDMRLEIPRGSYVPGLVPVLSLSARATMHATPDAGASVTEYASPKPAPVRAATVRRSRGFGVIVLLGLALASCLFLYGAQVSEISPPLESAQPVVSAYPRIAILPFANFTEDQTHDEYGKSVQHQIAGDFGRFGRAEVDVLSSVADKSALTKVDYVLSGSILSVGREIDLTVELTDAQSGEVLLQRRFVQSVEQGDFYAALRAVSQQVSGTLTAQGGVLSGIDGVAPSGRFHCVVLTDDFLDGLSPERFQVAHTCFQPLLVDLQEDPIAAASYGTLMLHAVPGFPFMDVAALPEEMYVTAEEVTRYAERLADRYPNSDVVFTLLGAVHNATGDTDRAIHELRHAVDLNPANPTSYGVLAYAYMAADLYEEARDAALEAIRISAAPQPYLYLPVLMSGLVHRNARLVDMARQHYAMQQEPSRDVVLLAAAAMIGDTAEVARLKAMIGTPEDPLAGLRGFVRGEIGQGALERYLEAVGVNVPDAPCLSSASGNVNRELVCPP
jgi:Predicted integral membrane protein